MRGTKKFTLNPVEVYTSSNAYLCILKWMVSAFNNGELNIYSSMYGILLYTTD